VFTREGDAPVRQLQSALQQQALANGSSSTGSSGGGGGGGAGGSTGEEDGAEGLAALQQALRGVVWTRSMRRMYTLVDRCVRSGPPGRGGRGLVHEG